MVYSKKRVNFKKDVGKVFLKEKRKIAKILPGVDIQHVGSTAIPNSLTKGDLDIQVRVEKENFTKIVGKLMQIYEEDRENRRTKTYAGFKKDDGGIPIGIQVTIIGSKEDDFSKLRDILLCNSKYQREYNSLKERYHEKTIEEYRRAKAKFFNRLKRTPEFKELVTQKKKLVSTSLSKK